MLTLYQTSGSPEIRLEGKSIADAKWERLKRQAVRILRAGGDDRTAGLLEQTPFELWDGTNGFGDQFQLLWFKTSAAHYLDLERQADDKVNWFWAYEEIARTFERLNIPLRFIVVDVADDGEDVAQVPTPQLRTSQTVERALSDFESLITSKGGAISGVDRIHTALHGYLEDVCLAANITVNPEADVTTLFAQIRQHHPKLQNSLAGVETQKILRAMAQMIDVLNPIRNSKSMAHPNAQLLDEAEARLTVNAVRTLLHYLNDKLN